MEFSEQVRFLADLVQENIFENRPRQNIPLKIQAYFKNPLQDHNPFQADLTLAGEFNLTFTYSGRTIVYVFSNEQSRLWIPVKIARIPESFDAGLDALENPYTKIIPARGFQEVRLSCLYPKSEGSLTLDFPQRLPA